jgi:4-amino-4-deoxy-L-arabinose transferase-like glycosyltransferase
MWVALIVLVGAILVASLPLPQLDLDTYLYAKIGARVAGGDWAPLRDGEWLIDKPPLQFWFMGVSFAALGVSHATIRAWHVAVALLLVTSTMLLSREAEFSVEGAVLAGLVLMTSLQFLYQTIVPLDDMPMVAFVTLAVAAAMRWRRTSALSAALLCGGSLALAVLAKGIAALAIFALAVGSIAWKSRRAPDEGGATAAPGTGTPRSTRIIAAGVVFAAIVLPWFAVGASREGAEFASTFLTGETIGVSRYFRPASTTPPPYPLAVFAYVPLLFMATLPWSPALVAGLVGWFGGRLRKNRGQHVRNSGDSQPSGLPAVCLWATSMFVVLSLSASDRVFRYLLPCLPPIAVIIASILRRLETERALARIAAWVALVPGVLSFGLGVWWLLSRFPSSRDLLLRVVLPVVGALGAGLILFGLAMLRGRARLAISRAAIAAALGWALFQWGLGAHSQAIDPWPSIARMASRGGTVRSFAAPAPAPNPVHVALIGSAALGRNALMLYLGVEPATSETIERAVADWQEQALVLVVPADRAEEVERVLDPAPARIRRDLGRVVVFQNAAALSDSR